MPANVDPIYPKTPNIVVGVSLTTASNDYTGIGANYAMVYTAGSNGGYVNGVWALPQGTNTASVLRVVVNNASTVGTATNNVLVADQSLPATTASATTGLCPIYVPVNLFVPAGYKLYAGLGTTVSAGWTVRVDGGDY